MESINIDRQSNDDADSGGISESVLSVLNKGYRRSKAEQILRLLKDQETLNTKFKEYSLHDNEGEKEGEADDSDNWSVAGSDASSVKELETKPKKMLKKQNRGRSKTSMGFHKEDFSDISSESDIDDKPVKEKSSVSKLSRHESLNIRNRARLDIEAYSDLKISDADMLSVKCRPKSSMATFSSKSRRTQMLYDASIQVPISPRDRADDLEVDKQRKRISSAKVDPLFRRSGVHVFTEDRREKSEQRQCSTPSNLTPRLSTPRKVVPAEAIALDRPVHSNRVQSRSVGRSTSFAERGKYGDRVSKTSRTVLSVDSNPLSDSFQSHGSLRRPSPLQPTSGEASQGQGRRPKSSGRKYGDVTKTSGRNALNVISEMTQPLAVMKLPPLESSLKKAVPERDILCYGKEAMV